MVAFIERGDKQVKLPVGFAGITNEMKPMTIIYLFIYLCIYL